MNFEETIIRKRDGGELTAEQITHFVTGLAEQTIPPEQVSALAMAIVFKSMTAKECGQLTKAMAQSGQTIDWGKMNLPGPIVDKHSTGGIGDKVTFIMAPIAAACGCFVPTVSGRGLGHTGGTVDKVESIPGYNHSLSVDEFQSVTKEVGCSIIGQTADIAPADKRLYGIRDITGTVESTALITSSILSKKVAAGIDHLVMDIKVGSGAFMRTVDDAAELATSLIYTAQAIGMGCTAVATNMSKVLGYNAGNALEIAESVEFLTGKRQHDDLKEIVFALVGQMLIMSAICENLDTAYERIHQALESGRAAECFGKMIAHHHGPKDFLDRYDAHLPKAPIIRQVFATQEGFINRIDGRSIGNAIIGLGGGRQKLDDLIDLSVGFEQFASPGDRVDTDERPVAVIHAASEDQFNQAAQRLLNAVVISEQPPAKSDNVIKVFET